MQLTLGDVRIRPHGNQLPIRVMMFDAIEVLYDAWWGDFGWGLHEQRTNGDYYRKSAAMTHAVPACVSVW